MKNEKAGINSLELLSVLLTVAFAVLKLTGFIDWSWWLVFLPMWIWPAIGATLGVMLGIFKAWRKKYRD